MSLAVLGLESASNEFSFLSPDHAVSICAADNIFLVIDRTEDGITTKSNEEDPCCNDW